MTGRSSCPECGTILRIRDRTFVGRRVNCPECKTALRVDAEDQKDGYVTRRLTPDELAATVHAHRGSKSSPQKIAPTAPPARAAAVRRLIDSPLTAAWLLAIAIMTLIGVVMLAPKARFSSVRPVPARNEPSPPVEPATDSKSSEPQTTREPIIEPVLDVATPQEDLNESISALKPANIDGSLAASDSEKTTGEPTVVPPAPPTKIDVELKLTQKLVAYKQTKPVSRYEILEALQEQLGAPIQYDRDDLGASSLDKTVTFELENTTIGDVIKTIADAAGWDINVEATGLRLTRKVAVKSGEVNR